MKHFNKYFLYHKKRNKIGTLQVQKCCHIEMEGSGSQTMVVRERERALNMKIENEKLFVFCSFFFVFVFLFLFLFLFFLLFLFFFSPSFYLHQTHPISKSKFEFQQRVNIAGLIEVKVCIVF